MILSKVMEVWQNFTMKRTHPYHHPWHSIALGKCQSFPTCSRGKKGSSTWTRPWWANAGEYQYFCLL